MNLVLDKYIENLDKRLAVVAAKDLPGNVAKKVRRAGEPSQSVPPLDAPAWAIRKTSDTTSEGIQLSLLASLEVIFLSSSEPLRDMTNSMTNTSA